MELLAYILAPFFASGAIYHLSKPVLDSIWSAYLTFLGKHGLLGEEYVQLAIYDLIVRKGF